MKDAPERPAAADSVPETAQSRIFVPRSAQAERGPTVAEADAASRRSSPCDVIEADYGSFGASSGRSA